MDVNEKFRAFINGIISAVFETNSTKELTEKNLKAVSEPLEGIVEQYTGAVPMPEAPLDGFTYGRQYVQGQSDSPQFPGSWQKANLQKITDNGNTTTNTIIAAEATQNAELATLGQIKAKTVSPLSTYPAGYIADAKATADLIALGSSSSRQRDSVVSAYTPISVNIPLIITIANSGASYQVGDYLFCPMDIQDLHVVVKATGAGGAVTQVDYLEGCNMDTPVVNPTPASGGSGNGCQLSWTWEAVNGSTLSSIANVQPGDTTIVLLDELHSNSPYDYIFADKDGDGKAQWYSIGPRGAQRNFTVEPIQSSELASNAVTNDKVVDDAITTDKVADGAIDGAKLQDGAVTSDKIANDAVTANKIENNAVTNAKILNDAVTTEKIAHLAVTTEKIADFAVTTDKIANNSVNVNKLMATSVSEVQLANDAVTTPKILNLSVTTPKLADGAVTQAKLDPNIVIPVNIPDGSITAAKLADNSVTAGKIANSAVTTANLADLSVTTAKIANISVTSDKLAGLSVTTTKLDDLSVTAAKIAYNTISASKIVDSTITSTQIANGTITSAKMANYTTEASIAYDNTPFSPSEPFSRDELARDTVRKLNTTMTSVADKVTNTHEANVVFGTDGSGQPLTRTLSSLVPDGYITTAKIAYGAVTTEKIAALAVGRRHIADYAISSIKIGDGEIQSRNIGDGSVNSAKISDNAITSAKIADRTIQSVDIGPSQVTNYEIGNNEVSVEKLTFSVTPTSDDLGAHIILSDGYHRLRALRSLWTPTSILQLSITEYIGYYGTYYGFPQNYTDATKPHHFNAYFPAGFRQGWAPENSSNVGIPAYASISVYQWPMRPSDIQQDFRGNCRYGFFFAEVFLSYLNYKFYAENRGVSDNPIWKRHPQQLLQIGVG
jgi:hypothetical protein